MSEKPVPILLMAFARPDLLKRCLSNLSVFKPPILYIMGDGPRNEQEKKLCDESRELALNPEWSCEVIPILNDTNQGIVQSFVKGMNIMLSDHEFGIYLEDDILLSKTFYKFAQELLIRYKDDKNVGHINATNIVPSFTESNISYYFSNHLTEWGFATWRRVWKSFDLQMPKWEIANQKNILRSASSNCRGRRGLREMFNIHCNNPDPWAWGYQWHFNCLYNKLLTITPAQNMSINIGCNRIDSTNTKGENPFSSPLKDCTFPLNHPNEVTCNQKFQRLASNCVCPSDFSYFIDRFRSRFKGLL